jgi:hypothetical protein
VSLLYCCEGRAVALAGQEKVNRAAEGLDRTWVIEGGAKSLVIRNAANGNPRKISSMN